LSSLQIGARTIGMKLVVLQASNDREMGEAFAIFVQRGLAQ
jgi:hypothetical protein